MPCKNTTYFEALFDEKAWQSVHKYYGPHSSPPKTGGSNFSDLFSTTNFILLMWLVLVASISRISRPEKMTPSLLKWISGFAAATFMACYAVFMAEQGGQLFSAPAALSYLICAPIALFVNGMILFQRGSYNVQPCSSEPQGRHHIFYLFIGVEYICVRYCLDKAPLGCVPNSKFLAYQEHMVLMTVYNLLAAFFLAFFIRILFAKKFVIFDGEDAEGKIEPPRSDEDMVVFNELVEDVQGLMEEVKSSKGDEKDLAERVKKTSDDLKNLMDFIKKTI